MKNSHVFWNVIILIVEIILGLILFGFSIDMLGYLAVIWGVIHSIGLLADMIDRGGVSHEDEFFPVFLFVSFFGIFCLVLVGLILLITKIIETKPIEYIFNKFEEFNNWLDRKK